MISFTTFAGELPKQEPKNLPDGFAQRATNCKMNNGAIVPIRAPEAARAANPATLTFYKRGTTWFEWAAVVDVAPAPIAENRLYFTGDGPPKMIVDLLTVYPIKLPKPTGALTASVSGTPDPATQATNLYTYTYITDFDEESEPAAVSNEILRSPGMDVTLTGFAAVPAGRAIKGIRLYRSQTSALGATEFYLFREVLIPIPGSVVDDPELWVPQELIPSIYYNPPPDGMKGIIALPNGIMAAFMGKNLYFSEPWKPHAWPEKYILNTSYDIVGLGSFGQSVAVMTTGNPYVVSGSNPDQMVMEQLEVNFPCSSAAGIVDLGYAVVYPSPDGLVTISSAGAQLVSKATIGRDAWLALNPSSFKAGQSDGRYLATYTSGGTSSTIVFDLSGETPFLYRVDLGAEAMFFEVGAGDLYILKDDVISKYDPPTGSFMTAVWRSKVYKQPFELSFGAFRVDASGDPGTSVEVKIYADGALIQTINTPNVVRRLPAKQARSWEIEISTTKKVDGAVLAFSPSQIAT